MVVYYSIITNRFETRREKMIKIQELIQELFLAGFIEVSDIGNLKEVVTGVRNRLPGPEGLLTTEVLVGFDILKERKVRKVEARLVQGVGASYEAASEKIAGFILEIRIENNEVIFPSIA